MGRCQNHLKHNNHGYTLIELIVVISIMTVLVGAVSFGVGLAFSKDAEQCATRINDAIYETRMASMSKPGIYTVTISNDGTCNYAEIKISGVSDSKVNLDGDATSAKTSIEAKLIKPDTSETALALPVVIEFDKSKGCVNVGEGSITENGIICITATGGGKSVPVNIITTTGKHKVGELD